MQGFLAIIRRDLALARAEGGDSMLVVAFFVLAVILFPFGVGPEPNLLARIAPGILWVTALLAALLSLDRLFEADWRDGALDQLILLPGPLSLTVLAKIVAHWLTTGLPLALLAMPLSLLLRLPADAVATAVLSLLLGTPALSLIGSVGAALVLGARRAAMLLALIVLPLYVPVLIFGAAAVEAAATAADPGPPLMITAAISLFAAALAPLAAALALREAVR
jgi:heme exporter protein B